MKKIQNVKMYVNEKFAAEVSKEEASKLVREIRSSGMTVFVRSDAFNIGSTSRF